MRWIFKSLLFLTPLLAPPAGASVVDEKADASLCQAAVTDSALPARVNDLMEAGRFQFSDAGKLLSLQCGDRSLVQAMVDELQAENLEYAVIDLGLDLNEPLIRVGGQALSLAEWLKLQSRNHSSPRARSFAASYLKRFRDESFNPNLLVSAG